MTIINPNSITRVLFILVLFILGSTNLGCALLTGRLEKPKVTLQEVKVVDPNLRGATLMFLLAVQNPNKVNLKVDRLEYEINVNNKKLTHGSMDQGLSLPPQKSTIVSIPAKVQYGDVFSAAFAFLKDRSLPYQINGNATSGVFSIPFDQKGVVTFNDLK